MFPVFAPYPFLASPRLLLVAGLWLPWAAYADDAALPEVTVRASAQAPWRASADAAQAQAQQSLDQRAGGTALVRADDVSDGPRRGLADVMRFAPGVYAQTRHGDETRFSLRGSGIQRGFLLRGVQLYQDGVPLNHADGAGDFQTIDPLATQYVEVWRGAAALEYGGSALGGAVNFVTPTGESAPPLGLRVQAGAFGARQAHAAVAGAGEAMDGYLGVSRALQDGWRAYSGSQATRVQANVGLRISPALQARLYLSHVDSRLQMPGALSLAQMAAGRRQAAPGYEALNAHNDYRVNRVAARLSWRPQPGVEWVNTVHHQQRQRDHAMTMGTLANDFADTGLDSRLVAERGSASLPRRLVLGVSLQRMQGDQDNFTNEAGRPGRPRAASTQAASLSTLYGEYTHGLAAGWAVQAGAQWVRTTRDYRDRLQPAGSYERRFHGFNPRLGLLRQFGEGEQIYASVGRSFEAPPFGELVVRNNTPMAGAQRATTLELGWRKHVGETRLDAVLYRSLVRGELLALNDASGVALGIVNAGRTVHQGLELGAHTPLGAHGRLRGSYLYNDFRFRRDPVYGDKRLAGIAPHLLQAEYRWQPSAAFWIAPAIEWRGGKTWIDHANTVATGGFALWHLALGGELARGLSWQLQVRNLGNRAHVAGTAVQADARGRDGGYYFPGDARAAYVGLTWALD